MPTAWTNAHTFTGVRPWFLALDQVSFHKVRLCPTHSHVSHNRSDGRLPHFPLTPQIPPRLKPVNIGSIIFFNSEVVYTQSKAVGVRYSPPPHNLVL